MRVAVTSVVVFEVSDGPLDKLKDEFLRANQYAIGRTFTTVTGRRYVMQQIERFEVVERSN